MAEAEEEFHKSMTDLISTILTEGMQRFLAECMGWH